MSTGKYKHEQVEKGIWRQPPGSKNPYFTEFWTNRLDPETGDIRRRPVTAHHRSLQHARKWMAIQRDKHARQDWAPTKKTIRDLRRLDVSRARRKDIVSIDNVIRCWDDPVNGIVAWFGNRDINSAGFRERADRYVDHLRSCTKQMTNKSPAWGVGAFKGWRGEVITVAEFAELVDQPRKIVLDWVRRNHIEFEKTGRQWDYLVSVPGILAARAKLDEPRPLSPKTINGRVNALNRAFELALHRRYLSWPMKVEKVPVRRKKKPLAVTLDHFLKVVDELRPHLRLMMFMAWFTGARWSDIRVMDWSQIKDGYIHFKASKTNSRVSMMLPESILELLPDIIPSSGLMFPTPRDKKKRTPYKEAPALDGAIARAGAPRFTFHDLKHLSVSSWLAFGGASVSEVSERTGTSEKTLREYYRHLIEDPERAQLMAARMNDALEGAK